MAKKVKTVSDPATIEIVGADEKPEGDVFTEWDILFKKDVSIKKKNQIIGRLLIKIAKFKVADNTITTSLKYQSFRSKSNELLYILRVYRQSTRPAVVKRPAKNGIMAAADPGPIRTQGPPPPKPPAFVDEISDTVGLNVDPVE